MTWHRSVAPALFAVVLFTGACTSSTKTPKAPPSSGRRAVVATFTGTGNETTGRFTVRKGWRIDWRHSGRRFRFAILGDRDFGVVVDERKPGNGVTSPTGRGTFYLKVRADGEWKIRIVQ